jgi:hypothetical protein
LLQELLEDPASHAATKNLGSDETAISGGSIKISSQLATNVFFGVGDTLGAFLSSFTTLHVRQGSRELYAESAHADSHELLTGHAKHLDFQRWLSQSNEATRSIGSHHDQTQFEVLNFLNKSNGLSFWREWYQGLLRGEPFDWELQRRVALIDDTVWGAGPEAVAADIERIKAEMLSEQLPMAETIELNPDTGRFRAVPVPVENAPLMSALLSQIEDAMEDCIGSHNGLAQHSGDAKKLNRVLVKYRDDPQNAELTLTRVAASLRTQLHDSRELPDNEDNLALLNAVEEGVRGIRANHPEVAANREQLAQQAFKALSAEEKQLLEDALPMLEEISEPELADDFAQYIPELVNDALKPLPDGAPLLPGADAATRVFSRVSKMALACDKGSEVFDSKPVKTVRLAHLGYTCLEFLYALVQVGLRILGVL